jgi:hypothetical protein
MYMYNTENIQKPDLRISKTFENWTNLCPVMEWLKQDGDHSKTRTKIKFSARLDHFT